MLCRMEILEKWLQLVEKMVYENVGQVLSLAKMQLSAFEMHHDNTAWLKVNYSRRLIGKSIKDLRQTTRQQTPQSIIENGFAVALQAELNNIKLIKKLNTGFTSTGDFFSLKPNREIILFNILQQLLHYILLKPISKINISILYASEGIEVKIVFVNKTADTFLHNLTNENLKLAQRLKLAKAVLTTDRLQQKEMLLCKIKKQGFV